MKEFDLDTPLINLNTINGPIPWTLRNAVEGVQIFGGIGSGKTSGSGRMLAIKYLSNGFGGLVLTAKTDERILWENYCREAGRLDDLIIIEPDGKYVFNFLNYEFENSSLSNNPTDNIVQVLKTVIRAGEEKSVGRNDDPFWEAALDLLLFNIVDLCLLAYGKISIQDMMEIAQSIPSKHNKTVKEKDEEESAYEKAFKAMRKKIRQAVDEWRYAQSEEEVDKQRINGSLDEAYKKHVPNARLFHQVNHFFTEQYEALSEKTRSIIDFSFAGFLLRFLRDPIYSTFCSGISNVSPDDSMKGKIIVIDFPVKKFHKIGRDVQILFKYIWQRAMEKRDIIQNPRPVFLWADEAQNFIHEYDADYQATARSKKIATVYLSQNLPNYYANMGGTNGQYKVKSFLGTLSTKIFHANADIETNNYASDLIGEDFIVARSVSKSMGETFSSSKSESHELEKLVRPENFVRLKTGSQVNTCIVEGYIHLQGMQLAANNGYLKLNFNQNYKPQNKLLS